MSLIVTLSPPAVVLVTLATQGPLDVNLLPDHRLGQHVDVDVSVTTVGHVLTRLADGTFNMQAPAGGGGGGGTFISLTDVFEPDYIGHGAEFVRVNAGETGLEFVIGSGGTDPDAIHDNVAGEIAAIGAITPDNADFLLVEDAGSGNVKGRITIGDLPGGVSTWVGLSDTPGSITAQQLVVGNAGGTDLVQTDTPRINNILDTAGVTILGLTGVGSAANYIDIRNNVSGSYPIMRVIGTADRGIEFRTSGTAGSFIFRDFTPETWLTVDSTGGTTVNSLLLRAATVGQSPQVRSVGDPNIGLLFYNSNNEINLGLSVGGDPAPNYIDIRTEVAGNAASIRARGTADRGLLFISSSDDALLALNTVSGASNYLRIINEVDGAPPVLRSLVTGATPDEGLLFRDSNDNELFSLASSPNAVTFLQVSNAQGTNRPVVRSLSSTVSVDLGLLFVDTNNNEILGLNAIGGATSYINIRNSEPGPPPLISVVSSVSNADLGFRFNDSNGNELLELNVGANAATNFLRILNSESSDAVELRVVGAANAGLTLTSDGTGDILLNASAGGTIRWKAGALTTVQLPTDAAITGEFLKVTDGGANPVTTEWASVPGGGSLDSAYDGGSTITVDAGPVELITAASAASLDVRQSGDSEPRLRLGQDGGGLPQLSFGAGGAAILDVTFRRNTSNSFEVNLFDAGDSVFEFINAGAGDCNVRTDGSFQLSNGVNVLSIESTPSGNFVWTIPGGVSDTFVGESRALTIAGTASQIVSSAGSQDLSADRTWTLSIADDVVLPPNGAGTLGFTWPIKTTTGDPAAVEGRAFYNTFTNKFRVCEGGVWLDITGGAAEVNNLESVCQDIEANEIVVGTGTDAASYVDELTMGQATVDGADFLIGWTAIGLLRRFKVNELPAGSETNTLSTTCTGIVLNQIPVGSGNDVCTYRGTTGTGLVVLKDSPFFSTKIETPVVASAGSLLLAAFSTSFDTAVQIKNLDATFKADLEVEGVIRFENDTAFSIELTGTPSGSDKTWTFPNSNDTVVGKITTDTFQNKTFDLGVNTLSGTEAEFNTALQVANFAFAGGAFHQGFSDRLASEHFLEGSIDHTAILNIGTNTHAQIDTHVGDATVHFTEASIIHANIGSLGADDHTQYALLAGRGTGQTIQGGTNASDKLTLEGTSHVTPGTVRCLDTFEIRGGNKLILYDDDNSQNLRLGVPAVLTTTATHLLPDLASSTLVVIAGAQTLADKSIALGSNTLTGTPAEFNAALTGDTFAFVSNNLSVFAPTTSAQLRGVITDETGGTGLLVFNNNPILIGAVWTGNEGRTGAAHQFNLQNSVTSVYSLVNLGAGDVDFDVDGEILLGGVASSTGRIKLTGSPSVGTTRSWTFLNEDGEVVGKDSTQILTNKTINASQLVAASVVNAKLEDMVGWSLQMRNFSSTGVPDAVVSASIGTEASPASGDFALGFLNTGEIRKFNLSAFLAPSFVPQSFYGRQTGTGEATDLIYTDLAIVGALSTHWVLGWDNNGILARFDADDFISVGGGNTLDLAYDQGTPGAGRTIVADSGAVVIEENDSENGALVLFVENDRGGGNITNKSSDVAHFRDARSNDSTNSITDDHDTVLIERQGIQGTGGGNLTMSGSALKVTMAASTIAGTAVQTGSVLELRNRISGVVTDADADMIRAYEDLNDTEPVWEVLLNGAMRIGAGGSTAPDIKLIRNGVGILTVENSLNVVTGFQVGLAAPLGSLLKGNATDYVPFGSGTAGQHLRVASAGTDLEWFTQEESKSITIDKPLNGDLFAMWITNQAITVVGTRSICNNGTSVLVNIREHSAIAAGGGGLIVQITPGVTVLTQDTITNAAVAADRVIFLHLGANTGNVDSVTVTVYYTVDP